MRAAFWIQIRFLIGALAARASLACVLCQSWSVCPLLLRAWSCYCCLAANKTVTKASRKMTNVWKLNFICEASKSHAVGKLKELTSLRRSWFKLQNDFFFYSDCKFPNYSQFHSAGVSTHKGCANVSHQPAQVLPRFISCPQRLMWPRTSKVLGLFCEVHSWSYSSSTSIGSLFWASPPPLV